MNKEERKGEQQTNPSERKRKKNHAICEGREGERKTDSKHSDKQSQKLNA